MDENFKKVVARTLRWEGGFVDNPNDPGGRTNKGITQKEYTRYLTEKGRPPADVKEISDDDVTNIYYNDYFLQVHSNLFANNIKVQWKVFDIGVNMGVTRALKFVQTCIAVVADGQFGAKSEAALIEYQQLPDWGESMMESLVTRQAERYKYLAVTNPKLEVFLKGWLRRAADVGEGLV
mgnify:CR=1 FL=1